MPQSVLYAEAAEPVSLLIVEDSTHVRRRMRMLLEESQPRLRIDEASGVRDALELFHRNSPRAVVLDLRLGDGDGRSVLREIKATQPGCVVIVLTNFATPEARESCLQLGADHVLEKSVEFEAVADIVGALEPFSTRCEEDVS